MFGKKKRKRVATPYGTVTVTETEVETVPQEIRDLRPAEASRKAERVIEALALARRHGVLIGDAGFLTADQLDQLLARWDPSVEQDAEFDFVAECLGFIFGEYLVQAFQMRWVVVTDRNGTDFAILHDQSHCMAFPLASVGKRLESGDTRFFVPVTAILRDQIRSLSREWTNSGKSGAGDA